MSVGSLPLLGVLLALLSAATLALGNIWQSRGVQQATQNGQGASSFLRLLRTRIWLAGTALFGVAIALQMASLVFAPLILVQPIGVTGLVFTALITARITGHRPSRQVVRAIGISLVGVIGYVVIAAIVSTQKPVHDIQLLQILSVLGAVLVISLLVRLLSRGNRQAPMVYILFGGIYSGFVATLGKTVILRIEAILHGHHFSLSDGGWLTIICVVGIGIATALSVYFVQYSHTCNPPDVVLAGLTVIDPAVAVVLGIVILREAAGAPLWSMIAFVVAGAVAMFGVWKLSKAESIEEADSDADADPDPDADADPDPDPAAKIKT